MVDTNKLWIIFKNKNLKGTDVAKHIGVSDRTMYRKMKSGKFTAKEALMITDLCDIEDPTSVFLVKG